MPAVRRSVCCPQRVIRTRVGMRVASNIIYIRVRFDAINVSEINSCRRVSVVRNTRCRCTGSFDIVCWLAMIVIGISQQDRDSRGAEMWSRWRCVLEFGSRR